MAANGYESNGKRRSALFAPLSFIIICAALVFALSVFFRVSSIEVTGNNIYTAEEVINASGIEEGDNLFFINRFTARVRILSKLPYVEEAAVNRSLPNKLIIEISESAAIAYVQAEDGLWTIDKGCKLLSKVEKGQAGSLIRVTGLTPIMPEEGALIAPGEAESPKVAFLSEILGQISALKMTGDVTEIDMSNISSPSFDYLGRFRVKLGGNENVDYKFQVLLSAVSQLLPGDSGTIDLSIDERAHLTHD